MFCLPNPERRRARRARRRDTCRRDKSFVNRTIEYFRRPPIRACRRHDIYACIRRFLISAALFCCCCFSFRILPAITRMPFAAIDADAATLMAYACRLMIFLPC